MAQTTRQTQPGEPLDGLNFSATNVFNGAGFIASGGGQKKPFSGPVTNTPDEPAMGPRPAGTTLVNGVYVHPH